MTAIIKLKNYHIKGGTAGRQVHIAQYKSGWWTFCGLGFTEVKIMNAPITCKTCLQIVSKLKAKSQ